MLGVQFSSDIYFFQIIGCKIYLKISENLYVELFIVIVYCREREITFIIGRATYEIIVRKVIHQYQYRILHVVFVICNRISNIIKLAFLSP